MNPYNQPYGQPTGMPSHGGPYGKPLYQGPASLSALAVVSTVIGVFSLPAAFCCCLNIPLGLIAIIMGHVAWVQIGASQGRLIGKGFAGAGFGMGYLSFALMIGWIAFSLATTDPVPVAANPGDTNSADAALMKAETSIVSDADGVARGNTDEAEALAKAFSDGMKEIDDAAFTDSDAKLKLSGGNYVTWCELRKDSCLFLVHVPEYRRFDDDAKDALADFAWAVAQSVAREKLEPGDKMAVGLKGMILFGSVRVGVISDSNETNAGLTSESKSKSDLLPFFNQDAVELPAEFEPLEPELLHEAVEPETPDAVEAPLELEEHIDVLDGQKKLRDPEVSQ